MSQWLWLCESETIPHHWDEILEVEAKEQMQEMGCDPEFIETTLEEMREGHSVTVCCNGRMVRFGEEEPEEDYGE